MLERGGEAASRGTFELRCAEVHPCDCAVVFVGSQPRELVERAREHGELAHCFTAAYYRPEKLAEMLSETLQAG